MSKARSERPEAIVAPVSTVSTRGRFRFVFEQWDVLRGSSNLLIPAALLAANLILIVFTNRVTLADYPNCADEYVFQLQAQMYLQGRIAVPSPEPREFFNYIHAFNDGRFYGKYPPGWPLVLALGYLLGAPWLVNPLLGVLTLILLARMARAHFGAEAGNIALYCTLACPTFVFYSATYYSHSSCLFFVTLFLTAFFRALDDISARRHHLLMGLSAGLAFLTRPYTAAAVLGPLVVYLMYRALKSKQAHTLIFRLPFSVVPFAACMAFFFWYNHALTGDALLQPFVKYDPRDVPKWPEGGHQLKSMFTQNLLVRLGELSEALPASLFCIFMYLCLKDLRAQTKGTLLVVSFASSFVAHFFYQYPGFNLYGPRYLYETVSGLLLISAVVFARFARAGFLMVLVVIATNGFVFRGFTEKYSEFIEERSQVFEVVRREGLSDAIVFLRTGSGSMGAGNLTRNGIHFDGPVLYVHDLGARNAELLMRYPERKAYVWQYDPQTRSGRITPYEP